MAGLGFLQAPCSGLIPFSASTKSCAVRFSLNVRNGRNTKLKCTIRTTLRAELGTGEQKRSSCPHLTIQEIPYVDEVVKKLSQNRDACRKTESDLLYLEQAYESCRTFCEKHDNFFFKAIKVCTEDQQRAMWAFQPWVRRIDDLVDSNSDEKIRSEYIDEWEERTKDIFKGRPRDIYDAALVDTLSKYHIDPKLFEEAIKGMRMDIVKNRYANFEELFLYCYHVAGTAGVMMFQLLGISPESTVSSKVIYDGAVYFGLAIQLTNILNDVTDDSQIGRVYLPQDELKQFGVCDEDILSRKVTDGWREFTKIQIQRARFYYDLAEQGVSQLDKTSRTKVLSAMMVTENVLDVIEEKNYDNLTKKVSESLMDN